MPTIEQLVVNKETGRKMLNMIVADKDMDRGQLNAILESSEEKTNAQLKAMGPLPKPVHTKEEIRGAVDEYIKWRNERKADPGYKKVY